MQSTFNTIKGGGGTNQQNRTTKLNNLSFNNRYFLLFLTITLTQTCLGNEWGHMCGLVETRIQMARKYKVMFK
mgnify:CR=1 FL=1